MTTYVYRTRCPLTPLRPQFPGARITPAGSLDLEGTTDLMRKELILEFLSGSHKTGIVSPIASYGALHAMFVNLEPHRYVPDAGYLHPQEGNEMFRAIHRAAGFMSARGAADRISAGFNWSELSWGAGLEEQGGFCSLPSKFHVHLWASSAPPEIGKCHVYNDSKSEWVPETELTPEQHRLLIENDYGVPLGRLLAERACDEIVNSSMAGSDVARRLADPGVWSSDARGAMAALPCPPLAVLADPLLFSRVIQPVSRAAIRLLDSLTESFTDMNCRAMRQVLKKTERGPLSSADLAALRAVPRVRGEDQIAAELTARELPLSLIPVLLPPIRERCEGTDTRRMWRRGFGFALVITGALDGNATEFRLMPGVYLGSGGVVEAQQIILSRVPMPAPAAELQRRARLMAALADCVAA